jgi:glutathione S-transferase
MIILKAFGPFLGSPDASPFVIKVMALLRMADAPHRVERATPFAGPHQFLPYIVDGDAPIPDSVLIRAHIERASGIDFDAGLSAAEKAAAHAIERMCEDHLYFAMLHARWMEDATFKAGLGRHMFCMVPAPARPLAKWMLRRQNAARLRGQGLGRHSAADVARMGIADIDALADLLGAKPFLMGERPCGADATVFGMLDAIATPPLDIALRAAVRRHPNLVAYRDRFARRYFPEQFGEARLRAA